MSKCARLELSCTMYITITDYCNPRENSRSRVWTQDALGRDQTWVLSAVVTIMGL